MLILNYVQLCKLIDILVESDPEHMHCEENESNGGVYRLVRPGVRAFIFKWQAFVKSRNLQTASATVTFYDYHVRFFKDEDEAYANLALCSTT